MRPWIKITPAKPMLSNWSSGRSASASPGELASRSRGCGGSEEGMQLLEIFFHEVCSQKELSWVRWCHTIRRWSVEGHGSLFQVCAGKSLQSNQIGSSYLWQRCFLWRFSLSCICCILHNLGCMHSQWDLSICKSCKATMPLATISKLLLQLGFGLVWLDIGRLRRPLNRGPKKLCLAKFFIPESCI